VVNESGSNDSKFQHITLAVIIGHDGINEEHIQNSLTDNITEVIH
jgi:hypothetical protein